MVNLVALILILTANAAPQRPVPTDDPPHMSLTRNAPAPRRLTPEQKAWFAHAIDHILEGK